jgi:Condensation domain
MSRPVQRVYRLPNDVNLVALPTAWRKIAINHAALRLQLVETDEGWRQIFPHEEPVMKGISIQGASSEHRAAYLQREILSDARIPIDLSHDSPLRAKVFEIDGAYYMSVCVDHLAADEIAFDLIEQALSMAYWEEQSGLSLEMERTTHSDFIQFIDRERSRQVEENYNLDYWLAQLEGAPIGSTEVNDLEWQPAVSVRGLLNKKSLGAIERACRAFGCSPFAAVLAAHVLLITQLKEEDDWVVNVPVSNRAIAADHNTIGNLSMLLHLRLRGLVSQSPDSLRCLVSDRLLEGMKHRLYDYQALSEHVVAQASARGGQLHWRQGCNFIAERASDFSLAPNFLERIDPDSIYPSGVQLTVPQASFTTSFRCHASGAHFNLEWDPQSWPISSEEAPARFLGCLSSVLGGIPITSSKDSSLL